MRVKLRARRVARRWGKRGIVLAVLVAVLLLAGGGAVLARLGGSTTPSSSTNIDLQKGLLGWWNFDGNTKDSTPYADDGTVVSGSLTSDRTGKANSAYGFSGAATGITSGVSSFKTQTSGTISMWVKPSPLATQIFLSDYFDSTHQFRIAENGTTNAQIMVQAFNNGSYNNAMQTTSNVLTAGTWSHIVVTSNGSTWTLYVNGVSQSMSAIQGVNGGQWFGAFSGLATQLNFGQTLTGSMDDVRIYNRVLNSSEIAALYNTSSSSNVKSGSGENGLAGWWKLDGNTKDSTPYGDNGSLINAPSLTTDRKGRANSAYAFASSSSQCMSIPNTSGINLGTVTASVWIKTTQTPASDADFLEKWNGSGNYPYVIRLGASGAPYVAAYDGTHNPTVGSSVTVNDGNWHMVTATRTQGGAMLIYVDGVQRGSGTDNTTGADTNTSPLYIGCRSGSGQFFNGSEDDVRIYNRVLSATEIMNLYNSYNSQLSLGGDNGSIQLGKGLIGYWPFNSNTKDSTPYASNATIVSASLASDRKSRANSAYSFSGATTGMTASVSSTVKAQTTGSVSLWVVPTTMASQGFFSDYFDDNHQMRIYVPGVGNTYVAIQAFNNGVYNNAIRTTNGVLTANTWTHVVITSNGSAWAIYINGVSQSLTAIQGTNAGQWFNAFSGFAAQLNFGDFLTGSLDDVRIYNRVLSQAEITALYNEYQ